MSEEKDCKRCGGIFPLSSFKKLGSAMTARSPTGATHSNNCAACRAIEKTEKKAKRDARAEQQPDDEETETAEPGDPDGAAQPSLAIPMALGVDVTWDGSDFVLTQTSGKTESTIWLAPHALRRLWEFAEGLAVKATAEAVPTA